MTNSCDRLLKENAPAFDLAGSSGLFSRFVVLLVAAMFLPNGKRSAFIGFFIRSSVPSCVYAMDVEDDCELRERLRASMTFHRVTPLNERWFRVTARSGA